MTRAARQRASAAGEVRSWKARHDALLDVLAAILLAKGDGRDKRLAIAHVYYTGRQRRPVVVEDLGNRLVVRFESEELAAPPELSRWQRIILTVRRWINGT